MKEVAEKMDKKATFAVYFGKVLFKGASAQAYSEDDME